MTSCDDATARIAADADTGVTLVSVVIPVRDDDLALLRVLGSLERDARVQVIVVDGGSGRSASPVMEAALRSVLVLTCSPGRARQMNLGATRAIGAWVLFLHADTRLPHGWIDELTRIDQDVSVVGGCFRFQLESDVAVARLLERAVALRVRWAKLPYGDQALFVRRHVFEGLGGFLDVPLMEDVDFVRRLTRTGRLHCSTLPAITSARRWEEDGWLRRSGQNIVLLLLYLAGVSPERLARWYGRNRVVRRSAGSSNVAIG
jgi:rSAM/selenodomain-associated transferase 2